MGVQRYPSLKIILGHLGAGYLFTARVTRAGYTRKKSTDLNCPLVAVETQPVIAACSGCSLCAPRGKYHR
jgi:hypothetical protein